MNFEEKYINLIFKQLSGEISSEENALLEKWINASDENKKIYNSYKKTWELSGNTYNSEIENINVDDEWNNFKAKVDTNTIKLEKPQKRFMFLKIAAIAILLISLGYTFIFLQNGTKQEQIFSENKIIEKIMPDSSKIILSKNTSIKYLSDFADKRNLSISGKAYFIVKSNKAKPFIIETPKHNIRVVGTEFQVVSNKLKTEVIVEKGIVSVYKKDATNKNILLYKGDKFVFDTKSGKEIKSKNTNSNYLSWENKEFNFKDLTLNKVVNILNEISDKKIIISDKTLSSKKITVSFKDKDLDYILKIIASTLDLKITEKTKSIEISEK